MRNLPATICLTITVLLGSAGVSWSADFQRVLLLSREVISQLLYVNGHPLPNRGMPLPSSIWV